VKMERIASSPLCISPRAGGPPAALLRTQADVGRRYVAYVDYDCSARRDRVEDYSAFANITSTDG